MFPHVLQHLKGYLSYRVVSRFPSPQGEFLLSLGAEARMQQLVKENPDRAEDIYKRALRLVDPKDMGERFKVMCFSSKGLSTPAGF